MMPDEYPDLHADHVRNLVQENDWAGLVRYWLGHQYRPALQQAVSMVQRSTWSHPAGAALANYLTAFAGNCLDPSLKLEDSLLNKCDQIEQMTLIVCERYPHLMLCQRACTFPLNEQSRLYDIGLQNVETVLPFANALPDAFLVAKLLLVQAYGQIETYQLPSAEKSLREAERLYRQLQRQRPEVYLPDIASTLTNLGSVQKNLQQLEDSQKALSEAEQIYRQLETNRPGEYSSELAMSLNNLGIVQRNLQEYESSQQSFRDAKDLYGRLEKEHPGKYLADVAMTLNGLGNVQTNLQMLEDAQQSYREAEEIYRRLEEDRPGAFAADLALTLHNRGAIQWHLQELEAAQKSLREALQIRQHLERNRPGVYVALVAETLNNLGNVQIDLKEPQEALRCFRYALQILDRLEQARPGGYLAIIASTLNSLGAVQRELQELENAPKSFRKAESIYRQLDRSRRGVYLGEIAMTLNNLGGVQRDLQKLNDAKKSLRESLEIRRVLNRNHSEMHLAGIALTLSNLGDVQHDLRELGSAETSLREAAIIYRDLEQKYPTAHLPERRNCLMSLGRLYLNENPPLGWPDRNAAKTAFRQARDCALRQRGMFRDPELRRRSQAQNAHIYDSLASVCMDLGTLQEALEVAEQGRSRNLLEMLAEETLTPTNIAWELVNEFRDLRKKIRRALIRLQHEETRSISPELHQHDDKNDPSNWTKTHNPNDELSADGIARRENRIAFVRMELEKLTQREQKMLQVIQKHDPEFDPYDPVPPVILEELRKLIPTDKPTAFVHFSLTPERGFAILVTSDELRAISLPRLSLPEVMPLLNEWLTVYYNETHEWPTAIPRLLEPIAERAVRPLESELRRLKIKRLIVAPHRALHLFPLHACKLADGRTALFDLCEVTYVPSLSILHRCAQRERQQSHQLLLVENPTNNLPFSEVEGALLREMYQSPPPRHHYSSSANKTDFIRDSADCDLINYTGHAVFDLMNPLQSGMVLESEIDSSKWLTLRDIFCELHLPHNRLTVINGCESGMTRGDDMADEVVGLPTGFLYAGSLAVVSTLWRVYDISSALLIARFHEEWRKGNEVGAALRLAQLWLRDEIRSGKYLQETLIPSLLEKMDDPRIRKACEKQAEHFAKISPDSPPFAGEVHWAAFFASGLTYRLPAKPIKAEPTVR